MGIMGIIIKLKRQLNTKKISIINLNKDFIR